MRKRSRILFGIAVVVAIVGAVMLKQMLDSGFSARVAPSPLETMVAGVMRHYSVPADLRGVRNPVPLNDQLLAEARAHWADHCATCHGNDGKGSDLGRSMYPPTPDMTLPSTQDKSDGALFATIENGVRLTGMPAFGQGSSQSAYASWALVHFIRHLPRISDSELEAMKKMNPITPAEMAEQAEEKAFLEGTAGTSRSTHSPDHHE